MQLSNRNSGTGPGGVQSQPKQDLKQFGDFSLGEVAVAAVSNPGSNYSKAAEIEFRRREIVIQIEATEAQRLHPTPKTLQPKLKRLRTSARLPDV
jgi:hypothetical protein